MIQPIAFFAHPVSAIPKARWFDEDILGLRMTTNVRVEWIECEPDDRTLPTGTMDCKHVAGAKSGSVAFQVEDPDAFVEQVTKKSAKCVLETAACSVGRFAIVEDPALDEVIIPRRHSQ
jgi:hypothetical protein